MKKHIGIILFYLLFSWGLNEFFLYNGSTNIDVYVSFVAVAVFVSFILSDNPQLRVWFLFWTLGVGVMLSGYVHQEVLLRGSKTHSYRYSSSIGKGYKVNSTVRNYSIKRKRAIEETKKAEERMKKYRETSGSSGSSYSGGSSHYGGGLSGGK